MVTPIWARHGVTAVQAFAPGQYGTPKRARRRLKTGPMLRGNAGYVLLLAFCAVVWLGVVLLNMR
jgi:hypothetical protein